MMMLHNPKPEMGKCYGCKQEKNLSFLIEQISGPDLLYCEGCAKAFNEVQDMNEKTARSSSHRKMQKNAFGGLKNRLDDRGGQYR